jgi:hypothetical protein
LRTELRKEDKAAAKELEGTDGDAPNLHPEAIEADQAKQLEVLFDTSPDSSLVFRPEDLQGTTAPAGADLESMGLDQENDITVMVDDMAGEENVSQSETDIPSINVSVSPDMSSDGVESAATVRSKFDGTSGGSSETTDKNPESDNDDE